MKTNLPYANGYSRSVKIDPFAFGEEPVMRELVNVYQQSSVGTMTLEKPQVSWASIGTVSAQDAEKFADAIKYAVSIAQLWSADAGHAVPWPELTATLPAERGEAGAG